MAIQRLRDRYSRLDDMMLAFIPDVQGTFYNKRDVAFFGDYPTLGLINSAYGDTAAMQWLIPQLVNLSEYVGAREKLSNMQLKELSNVIANTYPYLKITELMLFFYQFKAGMYADFYGSVDPLAIMKSIRQFMRERNIAYDKHEQEERKRQEAEHRARAISYEEYCRKTGKDPSMTKEAVVSRFADWKKPRKREYRVEDVLRIAHSMIDNENNLSDANLRLMQNEFKKIHGLTPKEYVSKHDGNTSGKA